MAEATVSAELDSPPEWSRRSRRKFEAKSHLVKLEASILHLELCTLILAVILMVVRK